MKKSFSKLLLAVSIAFLTGCGNDDPKAVAQKWQKAIASGDIKGANELSTKNTRELNVFIMYMLSDKDKKEVAEIKFDIVKIDGNKAVVTSSNKDDDKIELVKQDGKWLVDINKDVNADEDTDKNTDV